MNTSIRRTLTKLTLSTALCTVCLMAQAPIHVTVPFDFTVGSKSLAAGEYSVRPAAHMILQIQSADGRSAMLTDAYPAEANKTPGSVEFKFNRYGDRYFLSQISAGDGGWGLPKSTVEKELIAQRGSRRARLVLRSGREEVGLARV